ncbi:MAG: xanthine dehydrogenase family protein molybdopterin-binding subunit [Bacillati bacterium ANGP1]|uniref:Xanthine dehydrogenase family protein molybdopterin-binding subunit n=2 Tax=Candidatus Segetimicrobium genomatis TaxID=2569760 RepID=A0A537LQP8_9BACT|nr:MAG: xanthine dehydrogenase family protein molybdopterin-binding subunit [Terrabacteria group bacterium ANGP1]
MAISRALGARIKRREDPRLITGTATYVDDIMLPGLLHVIFVRSPHAHAKVTAIDTEAARRAPGVAVVWTGEDVATRCGPLPIGPRIRDMKVPKRYPLVIDGVVRHVGDPVAVVVATDLAAARDAADLVEVTYEPLAAVIDLEAAMRADAPVIHPDLGTNACFRVTFGSPVDEVFASAEKTVSLRLIQQRLVPTAMETRGVVAHYKGGELTLWTSTQIPHVVKTTVAETVRLPEHQVRVITPEVGGGFGSKLDVYGEEALISALSIALGRPVKWVETRRENFMATTHGRAQVVYVDAAATRDGTITGLRVRVLADIGAYSQLLSAAVPTNTGLMSCGSYRIPHVFAEVIGVFTNCTPTGAYRGAGRPEATFLIERAVDAVARALAMDPAEVRRRNFIPPEAFPFKTPTGATYDSGNYEQALDKALQMVEYKALREEQRRLRGQGRYLGIGLSSYVEITGLGAAAALPGGLWESATVRVEPTGKVTVLTGSSPHGQGEETTFAQIVTDRLGVPVDDVVVVHGDTRAVPYGVGTFGSRNTAIGGSAVFIASDRVREKAVRIAAHLLEAAPGDVDVDGARFQVRGSPQRAVEFKDVARAAYKGAKLPPGTEPGLEVTHFFAPPERVFPFGTHVCVVEIDPQTGEVMIRRYVAVDDCGTILNPLLVAGQVHGGIAQGLAQALYEEAVYDESGQLLTAGLPDYAVPKAAQLPAFDLGHTVTPSPHNPLGAKGVGEAGTIGATPAVVNAVLDALAPLGITHLDMPLTPRKIWEAIRMGGGQPGSRSSSRPSP